MASNMKNQRLFGGVHYVPLLSKDVGQIRGSRAFLAGAVVTCYLPGLVEFICQIIDHLRDRVPAGLKLFWCKEVLHYRVPLQNAGDKNSCEPTHVSLAAGASDKKYIVNLKV